MHPPYRIIPKLYLQKASLHLGGLTLELVEAGEDGIRNKGGGLYPAVTILADDDEKIFFEIYPKGESTAVRIPLEEIEEAIRIAKDVVHGETYYDREN
jgi:hypothetical protein